MKKLRDFLFVIILIVIDQITKYIALTELKGNDGINIIPSVFKLYYLENRGAAFGLFQNKTIIFTIITSLVLVFLIYLYFIMPDNKKMKPLKLLAVFVFAGAIGNFIDRLFRHFVVDFLYFELIDFPVFNVADCYVTVSSVIIIVLFIFYYKDEDFDFISKKFKTKENNLNEDSDGER